LKFEEREFVLFLYLHQIFSYLNPADIVTFQVACWSWWRIAQDDILWRQQFRRIFGVHSDSLSLHIQRWHSTGGSVPSLSWQEYRKLFKHEAWSQFLFSPKKCSAIVMLFTFSFFFLVFGDIQGNVVAWSIIFWSFFFFSFIVLFF